MTAVGPRTLARSPIPAPRSPIGIRAWQALVTSFRAVEATGWGSLLLGNVWPAYIFALPLATRAWGLAHARPADSFHATALQLEELVTVCFLALVVVLFGIRRRTIKGERATVTAGAVALAGTFLLNVVAYLPVDDTTSTAALLASSIVIIGGTLWTIWSLATLGRCFGLFPEVRGLVLRGPYRLVRHPVYLGELISAFGLLLAKPSPLIVLVLAVFVALQYWRMVYEERALTAAFPGEYVDYQQRVPRLVPGWRP